MGEENTVITTEHELTSNQLSRHIGEQLIGDGTNEQRAFGYLAGIAMDAIDDDDYDLVRTLMEFLRNERRFGNLRDDELDQIERMLRTAYEEE